MWSDVPIQFLAILAWAKINAVLIRLFFGIGLLESLKIGRPCGKRKKSVQMIPSALKIGELETLVLHMEWRIS